MYKRIYIEISNYCNLNCIFCMPTDKNSRMMSFEQFEITFNQVKAYTDEVCLHVLGEPTIHPDFIKIIKLINNSNVKIMLSTNGRKIVEMIDSLMDCQINTWNISLHSTYYLSESERISFLDKLTNFINLYQQKFVSNFHLRLWADTNGLIHSSNTKIKEYLFKAYNYIEEVKPRIRLAERVILSYEKEFEWPNLENKEYSNGYCLGGKSHIAILANGDVVMCCLDSSGNTKFGNVFENDLQVILESSEYNNALKEFRNNKCYFDLCKHCSYKRRG